MSPLSKARRRLVASWQNERRPMTLFEAAWVWSKSMFVFAVDSNAAMHPVHFDE